MRVDFFFFGYLSFLFVKVFLGFFSFFFLKLINVYILLCMLYPVFLHTTSASVLERHSFNVKYLKNEVPDFT